MSSNSKHDLSSLSAVADPLIEALAAENNCFLLKILAERAMGALWEIDDDRARKELRYLTDAALGFERRRPSET
jgi:hypothetical protein